jgi:hypothetical protein
MIGAVLCARNEEHVIAEWVAHHLAIGIERIHVFDHMSTDRTREILDQIHTSNPGVTVQTWEATTDVQRMAYNEGLKLMTAEDVEWCAFIDADEFIGNGAIASSETLADMLERHKTHCAIGLHWAIFGSGGHVSQPEGLLQENFLHRSDEKFSPNRHIKSLVRPRYTMGAHHAHGFSLDHPYYTVGGEEITWRLPFSYTMNIPDLLDWRLNHYFCQWRDRWDAKIERSKVRGKGSVTRTEAHWIEHDRNEVFDPSALRWTPRDKEILNRITA